MRERKGIMVNYEFTLRLNREVTAEEADTLYTEGCDDAGIETGPRGTFISFDREAPSQAEAIVSAVHDAETAVPGLRVRGVACDDMVTLLDIAERAGVSREAARLWSVGKRGPGAFPPPSFVTTGGEQIWEWPEVAGWLVRNRGHVGAEADERFRVLRTADRVLAAREALATEPDPHARRELGELLGV
jgi:hypothetical protein